MVYVDGINTQKTIMRKSSLKGKFVEKLRTTPIISVACSQLGISRTSYYRWMNKDEKFRTKVEEALAEGTELINDLAENQLIAGIKDKNIGAITWWLRHRNPKYGNIVELHGKIKHALAKLSPEDDKLLEEALLRADKVESDRSEE